MYKATLLCTLLIQVAIKAQYKIIQQEVVITAVIKAGYP